MHDHGTVFLSIFPEYDKGLKAEWSTDLLDSLYTHCKSFGTAIVRDFTVSVVCYYGTIVMTTYGWEFCLVWRRATLGTMDTSFHSIISPFGGIATPSLHSILCSIWIESGRRGAPGLSDLFGDLEHMGKVAYPHRLMIVCISDVNMHVGVLALPHIEYNSSVLRAVVRTLEAEFVGCIVDMISSPEHDGVYLGLGPWIIL